MVFYSNESIEHLFSKILDEPEMEEESEPKEMWLDRMGGEPHLRSEKHTAGDKPRLLGTSGKLPYVEFKYVKDWSGW